MSTRRKFIFNRLRRGRYLGIAAQVLQNPDHEVWSILSKAKVECSTSDEWTRESIGAFAADVLTDAELIARLKGNKTL